MPEERDPALMQGPGRGGGQGPYCPTRVNSRARADPAGRAAGHCMNSNGTRAPLSGTQRNRN
eukprot:8177716-Prorocentrum_lima.AAC.1